MSRVEWTRLDGNEVEAVVAMFVNRERPTSVRITPSIGDGGVDIIDAAPALDGTSDVYQVKKYTAPLTSRQKAEVEKSLKTLTTDKRWAGKHGTWYLVTPWDPTPEAYKWFKDLTKTYDFSAVWHGLAYVEQLAAKHPDVVDYYLHGGANLIDAAYKAVTALDRLDRPDSSSEVLEVLNVAERIERALPTLDKDPHYRYELRFGEGEPQAAGDRPGLVMTTIVGRSSSNRWTAVDVIARCAASVQVRPITVTGHFLVGDDDAFAAQLSDFFAFGVPFSSPEGVYEGEIDAPGGLGGRLERATVRTLALPEDLGDNRELHIEILDPDGRVLAQADVQRIESSSGDQGRRVVLRELNHLFTFEDRYNLADLIRIREIRLDGFSGAPVLAALAGLTFLRHCKPPNVGRISAKHTPPERGLVDKNFGLAWTEGPAEYLDAMWRAAQPLASFQSHTSVIVRMPDLDDLTDAQVVEWERVAGLLQVETVTRTYPEGRQLILELDGEGPLTLSQDSLTISVPLTVKVGAQTLDLGRVGVTLEDPTILQRSILDGRTVISCTTADRTLRYHQLLREPNEESANGPSDV